MAGTTSSVHGLSAADLMSRDVVTIPRGMSMRAASAVLRGANVGGAPVVDEQGRCVGMLSATDFLRWTGERPHFERGPIRTCAHQAECRLPTGKEAVICTLAPGGCLLQVKRPSAGEPLPPFCLMPNDLLCEGQQIHEKGCSDEVAASMTADVVTARPETPVCQLVQMMIDAHIHRIVVVDEGERPVGIVSATDVLAALAREAVREAKI